MKFKGGYNVLLKGRPDKTVKLLPDPDELCLPLKSKRFLFKELRVKEGQKVNPGDLLAEDPDNYDVPLLAPRAGKVRLGKVEGHIVIENVAKIEEQAEIEVDKAQHIDRKLGTAGIQRYKLLRLGAWQFMYDAYTGGLPDPIGTPQAVIVSTVSLEPFVARGDAQLRTRMLNFSRGLQHLQTLLEYQPIYVVVPDVKSEFASLLRNHIRGGAAANIIEVPPTYPHDHFGIIARKLKLPRGNGPVWALRTEGVLAVDRALTMGKPCLARILSVGGVGVVSPTHINVMVGYPLKAIIDKYIFEPGARIIDGGILTGEPFGQEALGVSAECRGITALPELKEREMFGFVRPGFDRSSYSSCFLSSLMNRFQEVYTTAMRGELRPCVSCNFCEEVCAAGISPHLIHKYLYRDLTEEAGIAGIELCIDCGLCSYVCPSKLDLRAEFTEAKKAIEQERIEMAKAKSEKEKVEETGE